MANLLLLAASGENFVRFLFTLIAFVAILAATYFVSKWIAGYQKMTMTNRNFEVVDSIRLSASKYIMLLRVGRDKYYAVGVGKEELTMLGELAADEVILFNTDSNRTGGRAGMDFARLLDGFRQDKETSEHHGK